jgi:hypothetical protein
VIGSSRIVRSWIHHLLVEPLAQGLQHPVRGLHPHIGAEQGGFDVLEACIAEGVVAEGVEQLGHESLAGLLEAATQAAEPVDLLDRHVFHPAPLGGQHLGGPGELGIESPQAGLGLIGRRGSGRRRGSGGGRRRSSRWGCRQHLLAPLLPLGGRQLQQGERRSGRGRGFRSGGRWQR